MLATVNKQNINSTSNIYHEILDFLILATSGNINIYLSISQFRFPQNETTFKRSNWEVLLFARSPKLWTLVDLLCTKRLFSQETHFFPGYFKSYKNRFKCSGSRNKLGTGALRPIFTSPL